MVKAVIAGSRTFTDYPLLKKSCNQVFSELGKKGILTGSVKSDVPNIEIISGTARGADQLGERFAKEYGIKLTRFPADWSLGKRAGPIRNEQMVSYVKQDGCYGMLILFWDGKSRGSLNVKGLAEKARLDVRVIQF